MVHPNVDVIRSYVNAFAQGDLDTAQEYLADDILYHLGGHHPLAGDHRGIEAVVDVFRRSNERTGGTFKVTPHDLLANDEHGVALSIVTAERDGRHYAWEVVTVYHLAHGKITECWVIDADPDAAGEVLA
ncbi:MAG: nuclear transport factor 2 family protein [Acidimicrobiales bacterium]